MSYVHVLEALHAYDDLKRAESSRRFFKPNPVDQFCGVSKPDIRRVARDFKTISLDDIQKLMHSPVHEERSLGQVILCERYKSSQEQQREELHQFYLENLHLIHDWDAVDDTAPVMMGMHLLKRDRSILYTLVKSERMWDRRIAMVSTLYFIRNQDLDETYKLAFLLLRDQEDLIHKATGWMLREAGKRDVKSLRHFLKQHATYMPRTTLRYAIERFSKDERSIFLNI